MCAGCALRLSLSPAASANTLYFSSRSFHAECLRTLHPELPRPLERSKSYSNNDSVSFADSTREPFTTSRSRLRRTKPQSSPAAFAYPISIPLAALLPSRKAPFNRNGALAGRSGEPAEQLSARVSLLSADAAPARALLSLSLEGLLQRCIAMGLVRDRPQRLGFSVVRGALDASELIDFCVATGQCASRAEAVRVGAAMVGAGLLVPSVSAPQQPSKTAARESADCRAFQDREGLLFLVNLRRRGSVREAVIAPATLSEASSKTLRRQGGDTAPTATNQDDNANVEQLRGATSQAIRESEGHASDVISSDTLTDKARVGRSASLASMSQALRLSPVGRLEAALPSNISTSVSDDRDAGVYQNVDANSGLLVPDSRRSPASRGRSVSGAFRRLPAGSDEGLALVSDTPLSRGSSDLVQQLRPKLSIDVVGPDFEDSGGGVRNVRSMSDASWEVRLRQNTATFTEQPSLGGPTSTLAAASAVPVAESEQTRKTKQRFRSTSDSVSETDAAPNLLDGKLGQDNQDVKNAEAKSLRSSEQGETHNDRKTKDISAPSPGAPKSVDLQPPTQTPSSVVTFAVSRLAGAITSRVGRLAALASPFPSYKREAARGILAPGIVGSGSKWNAAVAPSGEGLGTADHAATIRELISSLSPLSPPSAPHSASAPSAAASALGAAPEADPLASDSDLEDGGGGVTAEESGYASADGIRSTSPIVPTPAATASSIAPIQSDIPVRDRGRGRSQRAADLAAGRKTSSALPSGSIDEQPLLSRPPHALGSTLLSGAPKPQLLRERRRHLAAVRAELLSRTWAQGWLVKQGHVRKTWRRRWFLLRGCNLTYFRSAQAIPADRALSDGGASAADSEPSSAAPARGVSGVSGGGGAYSEEPAGIIDIRQFSLEKAALSRSALCFRLAHKHSSFDYLVHADEGDEAGFVAWVRALTLAMRSFDDLSAEIGLFLSAQAAAALHQQAVGRLGGLGGAEAVRTW